MGEAAGLRRRDINSLRSRIYVVHTAVEVRGQVTLDNEPKTARSKRSVSVARSIMRRLEYTSSNSLTAAQIPWCSLLLEADHSSGCGGAGCCDRRRFEQTWTASPSTDFGTASSRSWWPGVVMYARSPSGLGTVSPLVEN
jgi:hypothetical protein